MTKKLTKRQLVAAYKELDKVIGVDPPIDYEDLSVEEFSRELLETVEELVEPGDKFTDSTQEIFDQLKEEPEEPEEDDKEDEEQDDEPEPEEKSRKRSGKPVKEEKAKPEKKEKKEKPEKKEKKPKKEFEKTELGHRVGSQAGNIDESLLANKGKKISIDDVMKDTGLSKARVRSHFYHLEKNRGLDLHIVEDKEAKTLFLKFEG
jgi:outer membrane biosynthesis protein TonB